MAEVEGCAEFRGVKVSFEVLSPSLLSALGGFRQKTSKIACLGGVKPRNAKPGSVKLCAEGWCPREPGEDAGVPLAICVTSPGGCFWAGPSWDVTDVVSVLVGRNTPSLPCTTPKRLTWPPS